MTASLQRSDDCVAVCHSARYIMYYDPTSIETVQWMHRNLAWHGTMDSAAHSVSLGVVSRGPNPEMVAAVNFAHYSGDDVEISLAVVDPDAWSRRFLKYVFSYAYDTLSVTRVTAKIAVDNDESLDLARRIGFVKEGVLRKYRIGIDHVLLGMLREECHWINKRTQT